MKLTRVFVFLLLALSWALTDENKANATVISDIEIERAGKETRVLLKADGAIKDYRKVHLKKDVEADRPDRMYLDIKNVSLAGTIPVKQVGTALARVRTGKRADGFRVVFDSNLDELFDYTILEQSDGLLVTIREPSGAEPEKVIVSTVETIYPEPKAAGDLKLVIVTSDSPDHALEWLKTSSSRKDGLALLKTVKRNQEISTSFMVTGLTPDINGNFSHAVSLTLLDTSGKVMVNRRHYAKGTGKVSTHPEFVMADPELLLILDSSDPVGDYTIIGIVEDLTNNKMARSSRKITLTR